MEPDVHEPTPRFGDRSKPFIAAILLLVWCGAAMPAAAQDSRADAIAEQQAERAKHLRPYEPSRAERLFVRATRGFAELPPGVYPYFGSVYTGGGLGLGAGYRNFFGDRTLWDVRGRYSIRGYKLLEVSIESPGHATGRVDLFARSSWLDATQVAFYGVGGDTSRSARANFRMKQGTVAAGLRAKPLRWTIFGGSLSYEDFSLTDGGGAAPSIGDVHTPQTAPALGASPAYFHTTASAAIDWRPAQGYARRGGLYELDFHNYADRDGAFSFERLDARIVQHLPILRETWVLSFRGQVQTTMEDDDVVPYFLLPSLGSGNTLRAFSSWRFRDRHSLLGSAEWRWIPNRLALDMALFVDVGKVAARRSDLDLHGLKADLGIGTRFHGPAATPLRVDLARGNDGFRLVVASGAAF